MCSCILLKFSCKYNAYVYGYISLQTPLVLSRCYFNILTDLVCCSCLVFNSYFDSSAVVYSCRTISSVVKALQTWKKYWLLITGIYVFLLLRYRKTSFSLKMFFSLLMAWYRNYSIQWNTIIHCIIPLAAFPTEVWGSTFSITFF